MLSRLSRYITKRPGHEFTPLDLKNALAAAKIASLAIQNGLTYGQLTALAAFSRSLTLASDLEQILEVVAHHFEINFHRGAVILLPVDRLLTLRYQDFRFYSDCQELEAATWCWKHAEETGAETTSYPGCAGPLFSADGSWEVIGVLGLIAAGPVLVLDTEARASGRFHRPIRVSYRAGILEQRLRRLQFLDESDRLQNALLAAVSHEVRAPLAAITAAVSGLLTSTAPLDQPHERQLLRTAEAEAKRLHRLMNNLLNVTRLQAGMSRLKLEPCDLSDVVGAALEELGASTQERYISIDIPPDLPLVPMDFDLITQVLVNLFSNAIKFSPPEEPIQLQGRIVGDSLKLPWRIEGRGYLKKILVGFFKSFTGLPNPVRSMAWVWDFPSAKNLWKHIAGRIRLENNPGGGTIAKFVLPLKAHRRS